MRVTPWRGGVVFASLLTAVLLAAVQADAQRQMERLGRGVVAVRTSATRAYVGWRLLGSDPDDAGFNLYRIANGLTNKLNGTTPLTNTTDFLDATPNFALVNSYFVRPVFGGLEQAASAAFVLPANPPTQPYLEIPIQPPPGGTTPDGVAFTYGANDCSVGDLDGDSEYEIVVKWDPSNSKDNSQSGYTGDVFLDAYRLDGTRLWRIDLGRNIRAGAHYTQFMVYDLDGDGRAEVACKTAPGTVDGPGNYVLMAGDDPNADYRDSSGYILTGPEYLTIFNGQTGAVLVTTNYVPARGNVSSWGDDYGNRVDRFLACIAYLDGIRPSLVMCRGYYTRAVLAAWDWRGGQSTQRWVFDSNNPGCSGYAGQGNHSVSVADVDHDGKDEIVYGACAIDHDGTGLYTTGLGHGDAMHLSDLDPDRPGLEVWDVHETPSSAGGGEFRDARTGQLLFGFAATGDTGRGMASHIDPGHRGFQLWSSSTDGVYDTAGNRLSTNRPSVNSAVWWDADLCRELLDGTKLDKWTGNGTSRLLTIYSYGNAVSINGTKANPCLSADILGDWREEMIFPSADSTRLLIFITTLSATNRFYTFMHDTEYRLSVAWQNVAYNQPPHTSFYIGEDMVPPPVPPVSDARLVWRGGLATNTWDTATSHNWFTNGLWVSNLTATVFTAGDTVLFDLTGSNSLPIRLAAALAPGKVTVDSPGDCIFNGPGSLSGTMKLLKSGAGTLTLNTTNSYSGETTVRDGLLRVTGSLDQSPVTAWGSTWGGGTVGGSGCLGKGLTLQAGSSVAPGNGTNLPGTLSISNNLIEFGRAVNHFHLSDDPTGTVKTNDLIRVFGNLTLTGTNTVAVYPLAGALAPGTYTLISYSGTLSGGLANLSVSGVAGGLATLTNPPGRIALNVISNPAASLRWAGGLGNTWDTGLSTNWLNGAQLAPFYSGDTVRFDNSGSTNPAVSLVGVLTPQLVTVNASVDYVFSGTGSIGGSGGLTKTNSGALTILTTNTFTGPTILGGGTLVVTNLRAGGQASAIGAANADPTNLVFFGGTLRHSGPTASASRGITLNLPGGTIEVSATDTTLTLGQTIVGTGSLTKAGRGALNLAVDNAFAGGLTINAGTLSLGSPASAGAGPCTLNGGTLSLAAPGGPAVYANPIILAADSSIASPGSGNNNQALSGSWSGNSTLYLNTGSGGTFSVKGNMAGFGGTVVLTGAGTFRFYGSSGSASASFDLGMGTAVVQTRDGGAISLGALAGGAGTILRGAGSSANPTTFLVGGNNADVTFAGIIADGTKGAGATTAITKVGAGSWTLMGANTYTGPTAISAGTLALLNASAIGHSPALLIAPGATLDVSGSTNGVFTLAGGQTLSGSGAVNGDLVAGSGSILAPGPSFGTLTLSNNLTLAEGSIALIQIAKVPLTNDALQIAALLTCGGALVVTNTGTDALAVGDTFTLFRAGSFSGQFASLTLPPLPPSLTWDTTNLSTKGILRVTGSAPRFASITLAQSSLILAGSGGTVGGAYYVLASTNLNLPAIQWLHLATNYFDAGGNFCFTNTLNPALPQTFYLLESH